MADFELFRRKLKLALILVSASLTGFVHQSHGDIVTVSTSSPAGTSNRVSETDYLGLLDSIVPTTIGGLEVFRPNVPAGETFAVGDIVGRDADASGGDRTWEYALSLGSDAVPGTGFSDISFSAHAFEGSNNNLENTDEIVWEMFLNGNAVAVDSGMTGAGVDFTSIDIDLSNPGSATTNEVLVRMTVNNFNGGGEWFAARGTLSANYQSIPEPNSRVLVLLCVVGIIHHRRRID